MRIIRCFKYKDMPNLSLSTQELRGEQRQLRKNLSSRAVSLASSAAQLAAVNALTLLVMHRGMGWVPPQYTGVVALLAPYVSAGYSMHLLKSLGLGAMQAYPLGVANDALEDEFTRRKDALKCNPHSLDDLR